MLAQIRSDPPVKILVFFRPPGRYFYSRRFPAFSAWPVPSVWTVPPVPRQPFSQPPASPAPFRHRSGSFPRKKPSGTYFRNLPSLLLTFLKMSAILTLESGSRGCEPSVFRLGLFSKTSDSIFVILILNKNLWFLLRRHRYSRCPFVAKSHKSRFNQREAHQSENRGVER